MPLKLIECVLPWLVGSLSEEEARSFLQNIYMAGSVLIVSLDFLLLFLSQIPFCWVLLVSYCVSF